MKNIKCRLLLGIIAVLVVFTANTPVNAHGVNYPVIVDTDMAIDDIRAITMFLNANMGQIQLMVVADGVRPQEEGTRNLAALLNYFNKQAIPISKGRSLNQAPPKFRALIEEISLPGDDQKIDMKTPRLSAAEMIAKTIAASPDPVIYVCLGPLTNLADALTQKPEIKEKISLVLYYGGGPDATEPGWNTLRDMASAKNVFGSGVLIYAFCPPKDQLLVFDENRYSQIIKLKTPASDLIRHVHESPDIRTLVHEKHFYIWDELVVLYMQTPSSFHFSKQAGNDHVRVLTDFDQSEVSTALVQCFGLEADIHLSPRRAVVLNGFPRDPDLFRDDVSPRVEKIIEKYGMEEWKACVLTNEFHRHLGMYSIVGAKMGVRAREELQAPFDSLSVISYAGNKPPFSCLNDGLQVSTGASLGRGTIQVLSDAALPKAEFIYGNTHLTLVLKEDIWKQIKSDIGALIKEFGGTTPEYFLRVRELSIKRWEAWDRKEIFEESVTFNRQMNERK